MSTPRRLRIGIIGAGYREHPRPSPDRAGARCRRGQLASEANPDRTPGWRTTANSPGDPASPT